MLNQMLLMGYRCAISLPWKKDQSNLKQIADLLSQ